MSAIQLRDIHFKRIPHRRYRPLYCVFRWDIENFSALSGLLKSPDVDISDSSKWNLSIETFTHGERDGRIGLHLKQSSRRIAANLKLKGDFSFLSPTKELFLRTAFSVAGPDALEYVNKDELMALKDVLLLNDTLCVRCEVLIFCYTEAEEVNENEVHLRQLSSDLHKLYTSCDLADVNIRAEEENIMSHRPILYARAKGLANMLENRQCIDLINVCGADARASVLYMYTGNPELLYSAYSLSRMGTISASANFLGIKELEKLLTPYKIFARSVVHLETYEFKWVIFDFSKCEPDINQYLESHPFRTSDDSGTIWKLILHRHSVNQEVYGIYLNKTTESRQVLKVTFEIAVTNDESTHSFKREYSYLRHAETRGHRAFIKRDDLRRRFLIGDTLTINCAMKVMGGETKTKIKESVAANEYSDNTEYPVHHLKNLSEDMQNLLDRQIFADVTFIVNTERIKAHKAILTARSSKFANLLASTTLDGHISIFDIENLVFKDLIKYIYTATIPSLSAKYACKLYIAAAKYALEELRRTCSDFLSRNLDINDALNALVLACNHNDSHLKKCAEEFIIANICRILPTREWHMFRENFQALAFRILEDLAYRRCGLEYAF